MNDSTFSQITCRNDRWFIDGVELPSSPMLNRIWEASAKVLACEVDNCGANIFLCVDSLRSASKAFAGISQLLADEANDIMHTAFSGINGMEYLKGARLEFDGKTFKKL